ncbi:DgyrCDS11495 [Dimorphilus gyrociliatus]|uniref:DgyrCDS11495 n=1 Tax=Dimorphilus gyrociliatus TaxID=2664684 RepID=A0A7I8W3I2_9ANNE|nr:DgyrCDS11495 [Dimorphilus gyrociliatus]
MFKRKLIALGYPSIEGFNEEDDTNFRNLVVWLEDIKIRHYKIDERKNLRATESPDWNTSLEEYLKDLNCIVDIKKRQEVCDWLLGYAVRCCYGDNLDKYKCGSTSDNSLQNLDFEGEEFKNGVQSLAVLLHISPHTDPKILLKAINLVIQENYTKSALENIKRNEDSKKVTLPLEKVTLGFDTDNIINAETAKILRLLHIKELRSLQTEINEAIVKIQGLTANPKTDTKLGKVGK